MGSSLAHQQIV